MFRSGLFLTVGFNTRFGNRLFPKAFFQNKHFPHFLIFKCCSLGRPRCGLRCAQHVEVGASHIPLRLSSDDHLTCREERKSRLQEAVTATLIVPYYCC